jgi:S-methylmethionine-dependent homocysteine/selenocysteine methylase
MISPVGVVFSYRGNDCATRWGRLVEGGPAANATLSATMTTTLLDGPLGTELLERGVPTPLPGWSAHALEDAPQTVAEIHAAYALAGATVHTANTFRTKSRTFPETWAGLAAKAVGLCRGAIPEGHLVAGSVAPLEDCYEPGLAPTEPRAEHRELALRLADLGCDLLLCETFPHVAEGLIAVEESVVTGLPTWASFTAGPDADLLTPEELRAAAQGAVERGAVAVLVNCVPAARTLPFVEALVGLGVPFGAYANAGRPDERFGWTSAPGAPERYADEAERWVRAGATLIGSCCGTGPAHTAELAQRFCRP